MSRKHLIKDRPEITKNIRRITNYISEVETAIEILKTSQLSKKSKALGIGDVVRSANGYSVDDDDMHWTVNCPTCERELEYTGYFDSGDINKCKCGTKFKTRRVYFDNGSYIE